MSTPHGTVLVVGAGPTGLSAALALAQAGIPIRIVDRLAEPTWQSRAAIVHARTLELFERLGIADDFLATGVKVHGSRVYGPGNQLLIHPTFDHISSAYNFMIGINQSDTERLLSSRLKELGVEVDRGWEFVGFTENGDHVAVRIRHTDGRESTDGYAYVIGCDGARSSVRAGMGLHLEGETLDATWITADVKIQWEHSGDEAVVMLSEEGFVFAAPMNGERWRLLVAVPKLTPEEAAKITIEDVQRIVSKRLGIDVPMYDAVWVSPFNVNTRMTPTMNRGRIFLAGDASHIHSPVGGQGMNTGIQDAHNLAWKMALHLQGQAAPGLLESYNAERHANAHQLITRIGTATKMVNLRHPVAMGIRNKVIHTLGELGIGEVMPGVASMLQIGYPHSPIVAEAHRHWLSHGPKAGSRAPDASGLTVAGTADPQRLFKLWVGDRRHQLLFFGTQLPSDLATNSFFKTVQILRDGKPTPGIVVDSESAAYHAYGIRDDGEYYLVRPDGIIAFHSGKPDSKVLREYLAKWYPKAELAAVG